MLQRLLLASALLLPAGAMAQTHTVGPLQAQNNLADLDVPSTAWINIGGGAVGKLNLGSGLTSSGGNLSANVTTVFGRTGAVVLQNSDVTGALGFTPLNRAGDTMSGNLTMGSGAFVILSTSATVSAAGTTQGTATALSSQVNVVTTVAAGSGVILPSATNASVVVLNRGANPLSVYPPLGAQVEAYGTNGAVGVAVGGQATFRCTSSSQCYAGA